MWQQQLNQDMVQEIFHELKKKITHRTSEKFAIHVLTQVVQDLSASYEFLQYITIKPTVYDEKDDIKVDSRILTVEKNELSAAMISVMRRIVIEMKEGADFFFIKEIQDSLDTISSVRSYVNDFTALEVMQQDYLVQRRLSTAVPKTQLFIEVIHALLSTVNKYRPEKESVRIIRSCIMGLEKKHDFFNLVVIASNVENIGYYTVEMKTDIQKIPLYQLSESIHDICTCVGNKMHGESGNVFREQFKEILGIENVSLLRDINVPIESLRFVSDPIKIKDLLQKLISSLHKVIKIHTSDQFALVVMKRIINEIKDQNEILNAIELDDNNGSFQSVFSKNVDSYDEASVRKAMKELIQKVGANLERKQSSYITELKKLLGEDYVASMEDLGVNFHIFELKFY
jgi:hypothetical protein